MSFNPQYKATPSTLTEGQFTSGSVDSTGALRTTTVGTATVDSTGATIYPDNYAHILTYNGDSTLATDSFTDGVNTWTQTLSYTSGNLTSYSKWVKS